MVTFVWRNQARMTPAMAYDFDAMAAWFLGATGCHLLGSSGIRLDSEQEAIFRERYRPANQINGRRVYDWRWWNGVLWGRISPAGTVATPGNSNHQLGHGRKGAADLRDSGTDRGVTSFGTYRNNLLAANAGRFGFSQDEGRAVGEAWHYRYLRDPYRAVPGGGSTPKPTPPPAPPAPATPSLEDLMSLKSVVIGAASVANTKVVDGCILDFEDGFKSDWGQVSTDYNATMGRIFTTGGAVIVTRSHYDKLKRDFDAHMARKFAREFPASVAK